MKKKISWLFLLTVFLSLFSCRNDIIPEQQAYDNSSQFRLTSKRISLDQSRHKTKLISELEQAEAVLKKANTYANGKLVSYGDFTIDTNEIVYIENGPNYHTYTFRIIKQNEQADAPVENLIFTPLTDGTYRKLLVSYHLTPQEKQLLQSGVQISTKGKATVTVLGTGTLNIPTAKTIQVCGYVAYEYYTWCSENIHHNGEGSGECSAGVKSHLITGYMYTCEYLDTGSDNGADGAPSGTGSSGSGDNGGGSGGENQYTWQCPNPQVFTGPQQAGSDPTDQEGCYVVPTEPNMGEPETPCKKAKPSIDKANTILKTPVGQNMDAFLKGKRNATNEWNIAIGQTSAGFNATTPNEGNTNSSTANLSQLQGSYVGNGHSHSGNRGNPSGGDLYAMWEKMLNYQEYRYSFIYGDEGGNSEVYALIINDPTLLSAFFAQFPKNVNCDPQSNSIMTDSPLGVEFYRAFEYASSGRTENTSNENYEPRAVAMAYILDKYNSGISIAKVDANGNLKKINAQIEQITVPFSGGTVKEGVKVSNCP